MAAKQLSPQASLNIIRLALVAGVALFAAITVYQRVTGRIPDAAGAQLETVGALRYGVWGLTAAAVVIATVLKLSFATLGFAQQRARMVVGWAMGESAALMGIVQYYLGGALQTMLIGCFAFLVVLIILRPTPTTH